MDHKSTILFQRYIDGQPQQYMVRGRIAQTLYYLVEVADRGLTALEMGGWAIRLASYVYDLRHDYGLDIATITEPHDGGTHARYVLRDPVEILEAFPSKA